LIIIGIEVDFKQNNMINKIVDSAQEAVSGITNGSIVMIGGFGEAGSPIELIHALIDLGAKDLTVVSNNTGSGNVGLAALIANRQVRKMICSFPRTANSTVFPELYHAGDIELELVPQGTLAERIRAGGAGIPAFYTPASVNTPLAEGKESRIFNGQEYVLEYGIKADFSLVKCHKSDRYGNQVYNATARNFNPIMCTAATETIVQTKTIVDAGEIDPEVVITPGIFVHKVVEITNPANESELVAAQMKYPW
jgi:3-oxoadipate CoA-transferase alpha subunit